MPQSPRRCPKCQRGQLYLDTQEQPPDTVCIMCGWRQSVRGPATPLRLVRERSGQQGRAQR